MGKNREGEAFRRVRGDRKVQHSPWHRVDSTISSDVVSNCGHIMQLRVATYRQGKGYWDRPSQGPDNTMEFIDAKKLDLVFFDPYLGSRPCKRCWK